VGDGVADLGMPGILRVMFGFLLTAGLAIGVAWAMRKFWPGMLVRSSAGQRVRSLGSSAVSRTLTVHLVEVDEARFVVAESRTGVSITVLAGSKDSPLAQRTEMPS
jgi:flagellar biogenesis protein FliO